MENWHEAYAKWLPDAIATGHTEVNDAFRAGYLAAIADVREERAFLAKIQDEERREDERWKKTWGRQ